MSRSYHKQPISKDHTKGMKTIANRKVRRALNRDSELVLQNGSYKKYFPQYDICDWKFYAPKKFEHYYQEDVIRWKNWRVHFPKMNEPFPDRKSLKREWIKRYRGK